MTQREFVHDKIIQISGILPHMIFEYKKDTDDVWIVKVSPEEEFETNYTYINLEKVIKEDFRKKFPGSKIMFLLNNTKPKFQHR